MKIFRTRQDVIDFATGNAPTRACQRQMETQGELSVFGGVTSPEGFPGWLVRVNRKWQIGIWLDAASQKISVTYPTQEIPDAAKLIKGPML